MKFLSVKGWAKNKVKQVVMELYEEFVQDARIELIVEVEPSGIRDTAIFKIKYTKPYKDRQNGKKKI